MTYLLPLSVALSAHAAAERPPKGKDGSGPPSQASDEASTSRPLSIEAGALEFNDPGATKDRVMCWVMPRVVARHRERVRRAMEAASLAARPSHVSQAIVQVPDARAKGFSCAAVVVLKLKPLARRIQITIEAREPGAPEAAVDGSFVTSLAEIEAASFEADWANIWRFFSPPPPPPPPEPTPVAFVDEDLEAERSLARTEPARAQSGPWATLMLGLGLASRTLSGAPGVAQDGANTLSLGGEATLHLSRWLSQADAHDLGVAVGYRHRFVQGSRGGEPVSVTADRLDLTGVYRYRLANLAGRPALGGLLGYELLRFQPADEDALSTRYGVLRLGLSAEATLFSTADFDLRIGLEPALRIGPGASGGSTGFSFDVGGAFVARLASGALGRVGLRYARQQAETRGARFSDGYLDLEVGLGWTL